MNQESYFHLRGGEGGCEQRILKEKVEGSYQGGGRGEPRKWGGRRNEVGEKRQAQGIFRVPRSCWIRLGAKNDRLLSYKPAITSLWIKLESDSIYNQIKRN